MPSDYEEFDLSRVRTYPLASRVSKARIEDFGRPVTANTSFRTWFDSLPGILGARDIRAWSPRSFRQNVACRNVCVLGAHVIKTVVSPVLIDL